ncbi:MAG: SDR family oxidoreductase [Chloroflexota bacterium]|nr:SDR family oxidoreductase [Chloroflexota bacterium]
MRERPSEGLMDELFSLEDKVAVVIGGTGVLGGAMARGLARAGARVGVLGRRRNRAEEVAEEIGGTGGKALALPADVLRREQLEAARGVVLERWGRVDILVNAAGGNVPAATVDDNATIFDLPLEAFREVFDLNLLGTLLASQVLGEVMARRSGGGEASGCIVNVSSMAAQRPLTKVGGYSAAKAAVENLTRWLAVELSRRYGAGLRVNAIAPGFFLGEQNRALLVEEDGSLTPRGRTIVGHTPAGRFGEPEELVSTLIWLCGPGARFVNGIVVPVDGGFSAYSGV